MRPERRRTTAGCTPTARFVSCPHGEHSRADKSRLRRDRIDAFIQRWQGREGGQERANYALFLGELCPALGLPPPDPASATTEANDYVFEHAVREISRGGSAASRRIDLYKRDSFVLEAKQSRQKGGDKEVQGQKELQRPKSAISILRCGRLGRPWMGGA